MSEESAYPTLSMGLHGDASASGDGVPDLPGLFPNLMQDQEPFSSTDLPLPVSGEGPGPAEVPVLPPAVAVAEAPLVSETASEASDTNFGVLMAQDSAIAVMPRPESLQAALRGHPSSQGGEAEWHVMDAALRLARNSRLSMPWERRVSLRFSEPSLFQEPMLGRFDSAVCRREPEPSSEPWAWTSKGTFEARRLLAARFALSDDEMRVRALRKIRTLLLFYPDDSELGRNLLSCAGALVEESKLTKIIEDSFAGKAAGTLIKRATDFSKFATWLVAQRGRPLAPEEQALYDYVCHLRSSGASPTSGDSFVKAYKFMMHLTGARPSPSVSARVEGVAKSMAARKRPLWQAPELPVVGVIAVEDFVLDSSEFFKVVVGGFILFCLYASARWSDAARATGLVLDESTSGVILIETSTRHYKTKAKDRKDAVLPLIALGNGLQQPAWALRWIKIRNQLGLESASCLMPAVTSAGTFLSRPMTAAEGTLWLRETLHVQGVPGDLELYSSHSLKATALSWTAKSCTMTYEERLTQGHHCSPKHGMALLYSRDALAEILTKVARVVRAIQKGLTFPGQSELAERCVKIPRSFSTCPRLCQRTCLMMTLSRRTFPKTAPISGRIAGTGSASSSGRGEAQGHPEAARAVLRACAERYLALYGWGRCFDVR